MEGPKSRNDIRRGDNKRVKTYLNKDFWEAVFEICHENKISDVIENEVIMHGFDCSYMYIPICLHMVNY